MAEFSTVLFIESCLRRDFKKLFAACVNCGANFCSHCFDLEIYFQIVCLKSFFVSSDWLDSELAQVKRLKPWHAFIFVHHPFFIEEWDEGDGYFQIPKTVRSFLFYGICFCFHFVVESWISTMFSRTWNCCDAWFGFSSSCWQLRVPLLEKFRDAGVRSLSCCLLLFVLSPRLVSLMRLFDWHMQFFIFFITAAFLHAFWPSVCPHSAFCLRVCNSQFFSVVFRCCAFL